MYSLGNLFTEILLILNKYKISELLEWIIKPSIIGIFNFIHSKIIDYET